MIKQITGAATDKLQCTIGQYPGSYDLADNRFRKVTGHRGRLYHGRNTRKQINSNLLQHAPHWKIECVDMNGHSFFWHKNMGGHKTVVAAEIMLFTIDTERFIRQFSTERCIGEKITDAALYINPAISLCSTGQITDPIEFVEMFFQVKRNGLQHIASFVKRHFPERRIPHRSCVVKHSSKIQSF